MDPAFLRDIPDQSITKILFDGLPALPFRDWQIVFMKRDPDAIELSLDMVHEYIKGCGGRDGMKDSTAVYKDGTERYWPFDVFAPYDWEDIDQVIDICRARQDMRVHVIDYATVLTNPLRAFMLLQQDGMGELVPHFAAQAIDSNFNRAGHAVSS